MRVLVACPFVPWPLDNGGAIRTFHLLSAAARHVELELLAVSAGGDDRAAHDELTRRLPSVRILPRSRPGLARRLTRPKLERWFNSAELEAHLKRADSSGQYSLIHLDELLLARSLTDPRRTPAVLHHHKLDTVLYGSLAARPGPLERLDLLKLHALERVGARRFTDHLVCSEEDREILLARYPHLRVDVVQNGFDADHFTPDDEPRATDEILFLGSMDYGPNVDGVRWFVESVLPLIQRRRPAARLRIVGRDPAPEVRALAGPAVEVTGAVPDVRPALRRASLLAVPLRIGGGTRLKIAEALGSATAVVSTRTGAEGLGLRDGEHLRLADEPEDFATAVVELLADPVAAARIGQAGRREALGRFRWEALAEHLVESWRRTAEGR